MSTKAKPTSTPTAVCKLTVEVEFIRATDMLEGVERIKQACMEYGEIKSCTGVITPGEIDFGNF